MAKDIKAIKSWLSASKRTLNVLETNFMVIGNLVPKVLRLFGQRLVARRDSGDIEFYYCRISAVKQ